MVEKILLNCSLFKDIEEDQIKEVLSTFNYKIKEYEKDQVINNEGDHCNKIGIVLDGIIELRKIYPLGKTVTVARLSPSDVYGEVILFSRMKEYPSTLIANTTTKTLLIEKDEVLKLLNKYPIILTNLLTVLSNKILILNKKLRNLSYENIRQKIADYILTEYKKQNSLYIELNISRKEMAEVLGVTRPSLSRELSSMKDDNIIDYHKNVIKINDLQSLEDCIL